MLSRSTPIRLLRILYVAVKHTLAQAVSVACARWRWAGRHVHVRRLPMPERLRVVIEDAGGTFIKFGQMLALQPDILPLEYCNALFNLLDRVAPFDFQEVERIFVEETGKRPCEIFDSFDPQPIATASIGQVHVAMLDGRKFAVKVQRPNVDSDFAGDIRLMSGTIRLIKRLRLRKLYWVIEPMSEFVAWTREELDYRNEARYMEQLRRNCRDNSHERVPEVVWDYTTRRLLVAEFFEGETVLAYLRALETSDTVLFERLEAMGFDSHVFASNIIDNFLGDVFRYGIFHADLHPANLMILEGNVVGYIDFGITGTISRYSRQNLIALTLAYTRGDLDGMCAAFFKVSAIDDHSDIDGFREGLRRAGETWYETEKRERRLRKNFTLVMLDMLRLSRQTGIWPERDVIKYIRSAIAIDGLITRFAPGFNLGRHLETVCDRYLKWQARHALLSFNNMAGWAGASANLARDGGLRAASFFQKASGGELRARVEPEVGQGGGDDALRQKAVYLAVLVFTVSLIITVTADRVELGFNLFTAEALFIASAATMLLRTLRKLTREG